MTPLKGKTVLDLTHALAGPFCTYHLGMLGAEILKVEPPKHGDDFRDFAPDTFDAVNGGKRSVVLDLKAEAGQAALDRLVEKADVIIENFRPDVTAKLGITWDRLKALNPKIVYCSISGFGSKGERAKWPAVEWSVQAAMGLSAQYLTDEADPRDLGIGMLDIYTGTSAVIAVLSALMEAERTGEGRRLEVTMADAALSLSSAGLARSLAGIGGRGRRPAVGRFRARDRRVFIMAPHQRWFQKVAEVIGAPLLTDDPRFATPADREANGEALREELERRLAARDAETWQTEFLAAGVPSAVVSELREVVATGYFAEAEMIHDVHSAARDVTQPVAGATFTGRTVTRAPSAVPALGQDTDAVFAEYGLERD